MRFPRLSAFALASALAFPVPAYAVVLNTNDVPLEDTDRAAIAFLGAHEVIVGSPEEGVFRPNDPVTRAEILKIALEASGQGRNALLSAATMNSPFSDVDATHTLRAYILFARAQGYIGGYDDGTFRPNANVTRAEAAKIVSNVLVAPAALAPSPYTDLKGSTLRPYVDNLYGANWFVVDGTKFEPNLPAQRREVARMAYRALVANADARDAGGTRIYAPEMAEPQLIESDWQDVEEGGFHVMLPPGWSYATDTAQFEGVTMNALGASPFGFDSETAKPALMFATMDLAALKTQYQNGTSQDAGVTGNPMNIHSGWMSLGNGLLPRQVAIYLGYKEDEHMRIVFWASPTNLHVVLYDESSLPGANTTFLRSVQHAMELSGV